jgi:GWxTD domain-containing protein
VAAGGPVPYVGRIAYYAGPSVDSTLALLTISFPTSALQFSREGERYRGAYQVVVDLRSQRGTHRIVDANESVRVLTWEETQKNEESVIFQRFFNARPGTYHFSVSVRDQQETRASVYEKEIVVPNARAQGISTALVVYQAEARASLISPPRLVASPRSAGLFGRDSVILAYVETYGLAADGPVHWAVVDEAGTALVADSILFSRVGQISSGLLKIPVTSVGIGVGQLRAWVRGISDTSTTPLFMSFGDDLPVATFAEMLNRLRFYVKGDRLAEIRAAPESEKAGLWSVLLRDSDPVPSTPQHEGLLAYFERIQRANDLFRGELTDGWLTDRGKVWVTLGPPDQLSAGNPRQVLGRGARTFSWEYRRHSLRLYFQDRTGLDRWTLEPASEAEFNSIAEQERVG